MKHFKYIALVVAMVASGQAHAGDVCNWSAGTPPLHITRVLAGVMHVPGGAKPGDVIGTPNTREFTQSFPASEFLCFNDGTVLWRFDMNPTAPIFPDPLPPVGGMPSNGHILKTNIDGIGARIMLDIPFNGSANGYFMPEGGAHNPFIPFRSTQQANTDVGGFRLRGFSNRVTLVKTGDIAPGIHYVDSELFTGHFSPVGMGLVLRYRLQATVLQTQCSLIGDPVSADPVELGDWDKADFQAIGTTTATIPFAITLSNCQTDAGGQTRATIELDGAEGSTPVLGLDGVFSLTSDSDVEGIGIQILKDDHSPLPLQKEVDLKAIQDGSTVLNFGARFYQTDSASAVRPGKAKGALNFTIRYR
ncbi:type 1 fimbrial protein [Pseudomonas capeferrum]|uniref:fimbrial protein n=1 Tax=Pseudomonas capeferrum TaxID=1495066 RepID=UPI0015E2FAC5|nr:fimbrial protein [Pseudomonas capeferrum]MBA1205200.1 type 1 fimbrial protein [Pseudomonas capeferrum]